MIAGHVFRFDGRCDCGKRLSDIAFAAYDAEWLGKPFIAHSGGLSIQEQSEIAGELDRLHGAAMEGARI